MTNETFGLKFQNLRDKEIQQENTIKLLQNTINNLITKNELQEKEIADLKGSIKDLENKFENKDEENKEVIKSN